MILKKQRHIAIVFIMLMMWMPDSVFAQEAKYEKLPDGVEHWYRVEKGKPSFFKLVENLYTVMLSDDLPFGKTVAFLVGVSRYEDKNLGDLDFVRNDLVSLREYLLKNGGFDEVYVAADNIATPRLVEHYMRNEFRKKLSEKDRLLFYYSGHGADYREESETGYLLFSKAKLSSYDSDHWLPISHSRNWSKIPASHVLFIFDCCVSGLAFTKGDTDPHTAVLRTLSGNGSRTVITAGTGNERSLGLKEKRSVFTDAFLNALKKPDNTERGFVTISQVFAQVESEVKQVARQYGATQTPMRENFETGKYKGTFLFVDSSAKNIEMPDEYREPLKAQATPKGEVVNVVGIIQLSSYVSGEVYIDGQKAGDVENGKVLKFYDIPADKPHKLEVRTGKKIYAVDDITVEKGKITPIRIDPDEPEVPPTPPKKTEPASVKPVQPQAQTPKYQLRSKPITVSDDEFKKVFRLDENWRPLEYIQNDFKDNGDGTITDHATGLMWQKAGSPDYMLYEDVPAYIEKLNREKFAGHSDWRLPTVDELKSLITKEKQSNDLYINPIFDKNQSWCWTSDKRASGGAWLVSFYNGYVYWNYDLGYVRAVRLRQ